MFNFDHFATTNTRPKRIPPPPTPLSFPPCPDISSAGRSALQRDQLEALFRLKNVKLLSQDHLLSVNLNVDNGSTAGSLVPEAFLPPSSWKDKPGTNGASGKSAGPSSNQMLSNGAAVPGHEAFYNRMVELTYRNEDAYGAVSRRPPPAGQAPLRIAQFRRFWIELQHVGSFWDTSEDNLKYDDPRVQQALESQESVPSPMATKKPNRDWKPKDSPAEKPLDTSASAVSEKAKAGGHAETNMPAVDSTSSSSLEPSVIYTGLRHSSGDVMPSKHREDLLRTFLEPIAWSFGCVLERTLSQPHLHLGTTRLVADHTMRAFRGPRDRQRSRAKMVEGPLMALQCTHETDFTPASSSDVEYLTRELCALLVVAQERHREGKTEALRGAGKWWVEKQRWGGGTGEATGIPLLDDNGSEPTAAEDSSVTQDDADISLPGSKRPPPSEVKQQMKKTLLARSQKPPGPIWEKRVDYMRIGKAPGDEHDTVYLISCLNHHAALVRLCVHPRFLDLLNDSKPPTEVSIADTGLSWYGLWLSRSRWYDFLNPDDRVEMMGALWGVMGWLMRDIELSSGDKTPNDEVMTG